MRGFVLLACACLWTWFATPATAAQTIEVPRADGWVTDLADLITPGDEAALESELEAWKRGSGHELAVLTIPTLGGRDIEGYALAIARAWKLGSKETSDGALLVVARDDRKMRIEVGRGLEGTLTDLMSNRILRDVLTPAFRRGEFSSGIRRGVEAIRAVAGGDSSKLPSESASHDRVEAVVAALVIVFVLLFLAATVLSRITGARRRGGFPYVGPMGGGWTGGGFSSRSSGGGFGGFGGGGGFSGGGSSGSW